MIINPDKEDNNIEWKIGTLSVPTTNSYKYLGQLTEKKGSMKLHIQSKKQSSEANTRNIMCLAKDSVMPALLMETGIFNIEQLVHQKKLGFYHRISNMEENRLIKQVFHGQKKYYSYNTCTSSWVSSLESISQVYGIKFENSNNISKSRWKKAVKAGVDRCSFQTKNQMVFVKKTHCKMWLYFDMVGHRRVIKGY